MAKRRSSLKGRGTEILFGAPTAVEIEPRGPDLALAEEALPEAEPLAEKPRETEPSTEESIRDVPVDSESEEVPFPAFLLEEEDLELALLEEARDGEPGPGREEDLSVLEGEPPPTPEMESAFLEEALDAEEPRESEPGPGEEEYPPFLGEEWQPPPETEAAYFREVDGVKEPPEPVIEPLIPAMEEVMEEDVSEGTAIHEPPPPEISDVTDGVGPPRAARKVMDMEDLGALGVYDVQAGGVVQPYELPDLALTEEEKQLLLARMGEDRIQQFDAEISDVYDQVLSKVGENEDLATECHNQLLKARDIVTRRDAAKISQAEYYVEQVRARLKRATESERGAKKYAWWIAAWGLVWCAAYIAVLVLLNYDWFQKAVAPPSSAGSPVNMEVFLPAMVWGGIGGGAAVLYSLFKHVGRRDFDTQYNLSYVGKPFLGLILGATVYMIVHLMIMVLGILPSGIAEAAEGLQTPTLVPWIIYITAFACGFKENRILDLVDRVMKRIFSGDSADDAAEAVQPT